MEPRSVVEQAVGWLRAHLAEEISIEEMAEGTGVTPFHFLRTFRHWTGVTPALYLSALRLEEAKRLLLTTDRSVTDICFDVGYNSLGTFTTRFTQLVGLSPTRLRLLGSGFRLDALAGAMEHLGSGSGSGGSVPRTTTISGSLFAAEPPSGVTFLGLFGHPLPQQRPFACTLLAAPGEFRLKAPKPGRYYLFAACF
ncbi:MAG TPA: AraC family transcriptional regulator, partial [Thermoanaerobaculia bacterium]|nr:AraC family transcriptional regulator [Thermoanaerobaculia bacterium]